LIIDVSNRIDPEIIGEFDVPGGFSGMGIVNFR
jgi:hypothetical protein